MNTCKTCKWWGLYADGVCDVLGTKHAENPSTLFRIEAWAADDSGLGMELHTGPDFGCTHHEPKDTTL